ncbi:hypothetical protein AAG570_000318 [Ranatra chinensis]|uniref:Nuclear pore complex protein Nup88 n=1 Tax=Ranatra chinensis TaxID=642074 RepID=A0ABD0YWQ3_9HEMI
MASSSVDYLLDHDLFKVLWKKVPVHSKKCLSLFSCNGDVVYLWNSSAGCVEAINKKFILRHSDRTSIYSLHPGRRLLFNVERILLNASGTLLALWGTEGVSVMQLPTKWSIDSQYSRDLPNVNLGLKHLLGDDLKVRQVRWHPGSPFDCHVVVLTSDEYLRLYDSLTGSIIWSLLLTQRVPIRSNLPNLQDLGQTPVDFDFSIPHQHSELDNVKWPILLLWGTGDVYMVITKLKETLENPPLVGPLVMLPESDDNYGIDASSILILQTSPPVVILATCNGTIYTCLLLTSEEAKSTILDKSLHVVESIELDIGIMVGDEVAEDMPDCPIRLEKDQIEMSRYFCIHGAGIHSVTLPLVSKLYEFARKPDNEFYYNSGSLVEYCLCTALASNTGIIHDPILGFTHIDYEYFLVLLSVGEILLLNIPCSVENCVLKYVTNATDECCDDDGFKMMIQNILKSSAKPPLLKLPVESANDPKTMLEVALSMMLRHREEVFKTYKMAAFKIQERVQMLKVSLANHRKTIECLNADKTELQNTAEKIAELYEEINEKQIELMDRTEGLLRKLRCHDGVLNKPEKKLNNILENVQVRMRHVEKEMERMQSIVDSTNVARLEALNNTVDRDIYIGETKKKLLRSHLEMITSEIQSLTKRLKDLKAITS